MQSNVNILLQIRDKNYCLDFIEFIDLFSQIFKDSFDCIEYLKNQNINLSNNDPPFWYLAHLNTIYCSKLLPILKVEYDDIMLPNSEMYSLFISRNVRKVINVNIEQVLKSFYKIMRRLFHWIDKVDSELDKINPELSYCILRMLRYHAFINEIFLCNKILTMKFKSLPPICENLEESYSNYQNKISKKDPTFITIPDGSVCIGGKGGEHNAVTTSLENQIRPTIIKKFKILSTPVTKKMFCKFMDEGGYVEEFLWSKMGWLWKQLNNIKKGFGWKKVDSTWLFNKSSNYDVTEPVEFLSYWEAEAVASWLGGKLPTEEQLEYIAKTAEQPSDLKLRYIEKNSLEPFSVWDLPKDSFGCRGIIGGVWEWCRESIFPPNNYQNDPLWKDIDVYNLGKYCIKGGSRISIPIFIDSYSRYAKDPESQCMFIGVRVVREAENNVFPLISKKNSQAIKKIPPKIDISNLGPLKVQVSPIKLHSKTPTSNKISEIEQINKLIPDKMNIVVNSLKDTIPIKTPVKSKLKKPMQLKPVRVIPSKYPNYLKPKKNIIKDSKNSANKYKII